MTNNLKLHGAMTALVTPFCEGKVDWDAFGRLIEFQIEGGIQGLVPCGTTGESPTLSTDEHAKVIEFVVEKTNGRVPVIPGTGSNCTREAVEMTRHAKKIGADACLIVNPYYNKPTQEGMFSHVEAIGAEGLPVVLYNIPGRTGIELTPETIAKMFNEIESVVAVKEATGKLDIASAIAASCDITILSGDDSLTLPICSVGGSGVISVLSNILPAEIRKLTDAAAAGKSEEAREQHLKLFPLFKAIFVQTNPIPIKSAMFLAGMINDEIRLPLTPLKEKYRTMLTELLRKF